MWFLWGYCSPTRKRASSFVRGINFLVSFFDKLVSIEPLVVRYKEEADPALEGLSAMQSILPTQALPSEQRGPERTTADMEDAQQQTEQFVALLTEHRDELFRLILSLLPSQADAEDVFQLTSVVLWRKFGEFRPETSFFRWAARVAQLEVLDYCKRRGRDRLEFWTQDIVELIADTRCHHEEILLRRRAMLKSCLDELRSQDRKLIEQRYSNPITSKALAESLGRPAVTIYKSLARIRRRLQDCVERKLSSEQRG
ncbi:MAG: sigma-70 family RNA polymerase sigma factor [Planctomycetales bacterium]|nr:sigma-70 family RNA polymerase sigma factor [Planctomycetales bacterium]